MIKVYVFKSLPPFLLGYTRDIRALWALEECGLPYETIGIDCGPNGLQDFPYQFETILVQAGKLNQCHNSIPLFGCEAVARLSSIRT